MIGGLPGAGCGDRVGNDLLGNDARAPGFLTPRLGDTSACLTDERREPTRALKLVANGGVDLIRAGPVTRQPAQETIDLRGRSVPTIVEVIASSAEIEVTANGLVRCDDMIDRLATAIE